MTMHQEGQEHAHGEVSSPIIIGAFFGGGMIRSGFNSEL